MKKNSLLYALLFCSLAAHVFQFYACQEEEDRCVKTETNAPAFSITKEEARNYHQQFMATLERPDTIEGGIISRAALDELLCMEKCNGISYSFARDKSGEAGPENNGIFLLIEGVNISINEDGELNVRHLAGTKTFRSGNWCPPSCMAW